MCQVCVLCLYPVSTVLTRCHSPRTVSQSDPDTPGRVTVLTRPSIPTRQRPHPAVMTVNMAGMWALHGLTHRQTDINTGLYADIGARGCHIRAANTVPDLQHTGVTGVTQTDTQTHRQTQRAAPRHLCIYAAMGMSHTRPEPPAGWGTCTRVPWHHTAPDRVTGGRDGGGDSW